jgi:hypothetical protein
MIDLGAIRVVKDLVKEWTEKQTIQLDPMTALETQPEYIELVAKGAKLSWVRSSRLFVLQQEGWRPIIHRDNLRRPHIFVDKSNELVAVYRMPEKK